MEHYVKLMTTLLNIRKNVILKTDVDSKKELAKHYKNSDVFIAPSLYGESFGIVILEAMASMTPPIASYQGGIKEIINHKKTGFLFPRGNAKKLAEYIEILLTDKKLWLKISRNAHKEAKKYDWKKVVKQIEKVYKN